MIRLLIILIISCSLASCKTFTPISPNYYAAKQSLKSNDQVYLVTKDFQAVDATFHHTTKEYLVTSDGRKYRYSDLTSIETQKISIAKTTATVAGGSLLLFGFLLYRAFGAIH